MGYCSRMSTEAATGRGQLPTGRDEVAAAVLAAAADLFAERGPAATSIRDIAARSNVNHGLVFRHFGAKEQLVGAVLEHLGTSLADLRHSGAPAAVVERAVDRQLRVVARSLLDGYPVGQLQKRFPNVSELLDHVRLGHDSETSARLAVANAMALRLGWRLFEPLLRSATGTDTFPDAQVREAVDAALSRIIHPH